jgi:2-oxoglutarate/2-oxoacid ferredoxin oxidoreductase subunit alpha
LDKKIRQVDHVVIGFAGDSSDGMQLTGDQFTSETAQFGNDISTYPRFAAEIRAPAGRLYGMSSLHLHFVDLDVFTPGDAPDVLIAMNSATLKVSARTPRPSDARRPAGSRRSPRRSCPTPRSSCTTSATPIRPPRSRWHG